MATITGVNIYIDGVKHNSTPQPLTQATYNISNVKAEGAAFNVQFSYTYDDATESQLTAIQSYSLATTVISLKALTFESGTTIFNGANYYNQHTSPQQNLWNPTVLQYGNKNIVVNRQKALSTINLVEYDNRYGVRPMHFVNGSQGNNRHDHPVLHLEGGFIHMIQEKSHELNPSKRHRSVSVGDSLIFNENISDVGTTSNAYPNLYIQNGRLITIGQKAVDAAYLVSLDGTMGGVWNTGAGDGKMITRAADETDRYQFGINNKHLHTDIILVSSGLTRPDVDNANYFRYNVFRIRINADGTLQYLTIDGRLIINGTMAATQAQMAEYHTISDGGVTNGYLPVADADADGNFYGINKNISTYVMTIWQVTNTTPVTTNITFPDAPTLVENNPWARGACEFIYPENLNKIHSFWKVNNGTKIIIRHYTTTDQGATWVFIQDIDFGFSCVSFRLVQNLEVVGNDKNFMAVGGSTAVGDVNWGVADLGIKRASFGAIQTETNIYDSLTPITEAAFNANTVLSLSIESGKINNTSTTLDSLIDQSPNATVIPTLGSPVLDNANTPSFLTLDGINDAISVNPAILLADKNYLFLSVVDAMGNTIPPITISNNTNANSFTFLEVDGLTELQLNHASRHNEILLGRVYGDTPVTTGFHIVASLYRGYGYDVPMWLDGKMQLRRVTVKPNIRQGMYTLPNGNTNIEIGRTVRNTTGYYNFKMKHQSIHEVTSEEQVLDRIKYLGNKYGITLLNAYR